MKYYIGADLGTSALKLLLVDSDGVIIKTVTNSYDVVYPNPGWSEQSPEDWWDALVSGIKELVSDIDVSLISGIGVAGQMHGLVALDKDDKLCQYSGLPQAAYKLEGVADGDYYIIGTYSANEMIDGRSVRIFDTTICNVQVVDIG